MSCECKHRRSGSISQLMILYPLLKMVSMFSCSICSLTAWKTSLMFSVSVAHVKWWENSLSESNCSLNFCKMNWRPDSTSCCGPMQRRGKMEATTPNYCRMNMSFCYRAIKIPHELTSLPVYSGKYWFRCDFFIFSAKRSVLFMKMIIAHFKKKG